MSHITEEAHKRNQIAALYVVDSELDQALHLLKTEDGVKSVKTRQAIFHLEHAKMRNNKVDANKTSIRKMPFDICVTCGKVN